MKSKSKSAFIIMLAAGLLLVGCNSENGPSTLPHVAGGIEVPQQVLDQPRVVQVPPPQDFSNLDYPRLGDVPAKPQTFSPKPVLDQGFNELEYDRAQAQKDLYNYQHPQPTEYNP